MRRPDQGTLGEESETCAIQMLKIEFVYKIYPIPIT